MVKIFLLSALLSFAWAQTKDVSQGTGCFATLYPEENYQGSGTVVADGVDLPEWNKDVGSIIVGPKARLILYGRTYWKDRDYTIAPATKVKSVDTLPWNDVESLKLECVP
jgi:hypothetical protein